MEQKNIIKIYCQAKKASALYVDFSYDFWNQVVALHQIVLCEEIDNCPEQQLFVLNIPPALDPIFSISKVKKKKTIK